MLDEPAPANAALRDREDAPPWLREAVALCRSGDPLNMATEPAFYRAMAFVDKRFHIGVPWCGAFVAHCLRKALPDVQIPRCHLRARPWTTWGRPTALRRGAVVTFWRLHPSSPFGHVGFYWDEDAESFHVLGGNQHDRIELSRYPKDHLIACRWPDRGADRGGA